MADTQRSVSAIKTLLADNTSEAISEQDIRDTVETVINRYGELYISSEAATTISSTSTYVDIAGTWTLSENSGFSEPVNGRLRYDGVADVEALILGTVTMRCDGSNNQVVHIRAAKNGVDIAASDETVKLVSSGVQYTMSMMALTGLSTNDYITIETRNETGTNDLTAEHANLIVLTFAK